jgi:DNA-binding IclR family transcriptional regulator
MVDFTPIYIARTLVVLDYMRLHKRTRISTLVADLGFSRKNLYGSLNRLRDDGFVSRLPGDVWILVV